LLTITRVVEIWQISELHLSKNWHIWEC
jgi:hypothetical protein